MVSTFLSCLVFDLGRRTYLPARAHCSQTPAHDLPACPFKEFLLNSYCSGSPTDANGVAARTTLLKNVQTVNCAPSTSVASSSSRVVQLRLRCVSSSATIQAMGLSKHIPLGTSDAGSAATLTLCEGLDEFFGNVHPW